MPDLFDQGPPQTQQSGQDAWTQGPPQEVPTGVGKPDWLQTLLNANTNYSHQGFLLNPAGVLQGVGKEAASLGYTGADILNSMFKTSGVPGQDPRLIKYDPAYRESVTTPTDFNQTLGKGLAQAAEFAVPAGYVGGALKTAPLAARALAQAGVGAAVSGVQSEGNPEAMAAGGLLGAGAEFVPVNAIAKYGSRLWENSPAIASALGKGVSNSLPTAATAAALSHIPGVGPYLSGGILSSLPKQLTDAGVFTDLKSAFSNLLTKPTAAEIAERTAANLTKSNIRKASTFETLRDRFPDTAEEISSAPRTSSESVQLPSGRQPGGIQNQTAAPGPRGEPAWKSIPNTSPQPESVTGYPQVGVLPSGRQPGGIQNQSIITPTGSNVVSRGEPAWKNIPDVIQQPEIAPNQSQVGVLPSGRQPGGIQNQSIITPTGSNVVSRGEPAWKNIPDVIQQPETVTGYPQVSVLPSGRQPGGIRNYGVMPISDNTKDILKDAAGSGKLAVLPDGAKAELSDALDKGHFIEAQTVVDSGRELTEAEKNHITATENKAIALHRYTTENNIDINPFIDSANKIDKFRDDSGIPSQKGISTIRKAAVDANRQDIVAMIDQQQALADKTREYAMSNGLPTADSKYKGISSGTWGVVNNEIRNAAPKAIVSPVAKAGLWPDMPSTTMAALQSASRSGVLSRADSQSIVAIQNALKRRDSASVVSILKTLK